MRGSIAGSRVRPVRAAYDSVGRFRLGRRTPDPLGFLRVPGRIANPGSPNLALILRCRSAAEASKEPSSDRCAGWSSPSRPLRGTSG